jgi:hypothetical protein
MFLETNKNKAVLLVTFMSRSAIKLECILNMKIYSLIPTGSVKQFWKASTLYIIYLLWQGPLELADESVIKRLWIQTDVTSCVVVEVLTRKLYSAWTNVNVNFTGVVTSYVKTAQRLLKDILVEARFHTQGPHIEITDWDCRKIQLVSWVCNIWRNLKKNLQRLRPYSFTHIIWLFVSLFIWSDF